MTRKLHNTFSALTATAILAVGLMVAAPARQEAASLASQTQPTVAAPGHTAAADARQRAALARAKAVEDHADILARQLERSADSKEALGHVAAFTAVVVTEAALAAAFDDSSEIGKIESQISEEEKPARKSRRTRQSLVMPYFSFATRG